MQNKAIHLLLLLLLFPLFFLLHGYNTHFGLVPLSIAPVLLLKYSIVMAAFFGAGIVFFRIAEKAFLFALVLSLLYFFYGKLHDELNALGENAFFSSYTFLLLIYGALITISALALRKLRQPSKGLIRYCSVVLLVLVGIELVTLIAGVMLLKRKASILNEVPYNRGIITLVNPDLYIIVFDELANTPSLLELGVDSLKLRSFDSTLVSHGFQTFSNSLSNYNYTTLSLSSFLSGSYMNISDGDTMDL